jgi:HNH endonuclease
MAASHPIKSKTCIQCRTEKPVDEFGLQGLPSGARRNICKSCGIERQRKWRARRRPARVITPHPDILGVRFEDIPGFPGYLAGDDGSIWSSRVIGGRAGTRDCHWRKLTGCPRFGRDNKYLAVTLTGQDGKRRMFAIHRLVLIAFVGPCRTGEEGCHYDGDARNNCLSNLRWDTHEANCQDSARQGVLGGGRGERNRHAKLEESDIPEIMKLHRLGMSYRAIAGKFGVGRMAIGRIVTGETWKHLA